MTVEEQVTIEISTWTGSAQRSDFWEVCKRMQDACPGLTGEALGCLGTSDYWTLTGSSAGIRRALDWLLQEGEVRRTARQGGRRAG